MAALLRRSNLPANPCLANILASASRPWRKSMTSPTDGPPSPDGETHAGHSQLARAIERGIFASRWLLAPMYLGLAVSLLLLLGKFVQETVELARHTGTEDVHKLITGILSLVDLSLMGNLVVMVMFAGYENFVSRFEEVTKGNRPDWMGKVGFGALKLKLMTSIIAIAAIHMLEDFMHVAEIDNRELGWGVGILLAFVVSGLLLALMDRLSGSGH
jgi:uncharacterized protein (TIGR00645 family)